MIEHFFTVLAACGGLPLPPLRGPPPPPECGGGQVYGGKRNRVTTSLAHPCFRGGGECSEPEGVGRKAAFLLTGI